MNARFSEAFDKFVTEVKQDSCVLGILFFGTAQRNEETEASDLDFYIVVDGVEGWNYKKYTNDVPVEAYFFTEDYWKGMIKESAHVMNAFVTGKIIYDINGATRRIRESVQTIYNQGPPKLSSLQKANWRITMTELLSDINGLKTESNHSIFLGSAITKALEGYCELSHLWPVKTEKLAPILRTYDEELGFYIDRYENEPGISSASAIIQYVLDKHGGPIKEYEGPRLNLNHL